MPQRKKKIYIYKHKSKINSHFKQSHFWIKCIKLHSQLCNYVTNLKKKQFISLELIKFNYLNFPQMILHFKNYKGPSFTPADVIRLWLTLHCEVDPFHDALAIWRRQLVRHDFSPPEVLDEKALLFAKKKF